MSYVSNTAVCASGAISRIHRRGVERLAVRLKLSAATGVRWQRKLRETGTVAPEAQGRPPGGGKLAAHRTFLENLVEQDRDMTLPELAGTLEAATGVVAHSASIGRFLRRLGYMHKKVVGRDRTVPRTCETPPTGLDQASHPDHARVIPVRFLRHSCDMNLTGMRQSARFWKAGEVAWAKRYGWARTRLLCVFFCYSFHPCSAHVPWKR